jgi:hypothetical protein
MYSAPYSFDPGSKTPAPDLLSIVVASLVDAMPTAITQYPFVCSFSLNSFMTAISLGEAVPDSLSITEIKKRIIKS